MDWLARIQSLFVTDRNDFDEKEMPSAALESHRGHRLGQGEWEAQTNRTVGGVK